MSQPYSDKDGVASYYNLRRAIGCLGIGLPIACMIHSAVQSTGLEMSISTYYHTGIRDLFVGVLYVLGTFLLTYRFRREDFVPTVLAGGSAFMITMFCTSDISRYEHRPKIAGYEDTLHVLFAGLLFLSFAYMSIRLFTRTYSGDTGGGFLHLFRDPEKERGLSEAKQVRNKVYRRCGWVIIACVALIGLNSGVKFIPEGSNPTYWLETISLFSFGFSWLVKGRTLWQDELETEPLEDPAVEKAFA